MWAVGAHDRGLLGDDVDLGGGDAAAQHRLGVERPAADRQPLEQLADLVEVGAGVDERAERHVAGDAGEAVEPGDRAARRSAIGASEDAQSGDAPRRSRCRCRRR